METKYLVVYLVRMYRVCFVRQSIHVQFEFKFVCNLYFVFIVIIFEILPGIHIEVRIATGTPVR